MKKSRLLGVVCALFLCFSASTGAQAGNIPLVNSGFETDDATGGDAFGATGWTAFGGGTFTTDGTNGPGAFPNCCSPVALSGVNSFKVFNISGAYQSFAATAGDVFAMSGYGLNFGSDPLLSSSQAFLQIAFFDANGLPAGTEAAGNAAPFFNLFDGNPVDANTPQDVWTALGVITAPAPDNTAEVRFIVLGLAGAGGAGFFDDISAVQVVPVPAAVWLFGSGLIGLIGVARRKKTA
jgi:hypothetical protein